MSKARWKVWQLDGTGIPGERLWCWHVETRGGQRFYGKAYTRTGAMRKTRRCLQDLKELL